MGGKDHTICGKSRPPPDGTGGWADRDLGQQRPRRAKHATDPLDLLAGAFCRRYQPMVRLAQLLLGDRASAEDVVQEAYARLHGRIASLSDPAGADAYLRVIVVNLARSAQRRRSLTRRHAAADPTAKDAVDDGAQARAEREAVLVALQRIARRQRECLVLRYYLDLPQAEVAGVLGISQGSVKTHTSRGLAAMAKLLGER